MSVITQNTLLSFNTPTVSVDCTNGNITLYLPNYQQYLQYFGNNISSVNNSVFKFEIKRIDSSGNTLIITTSATVTNIDGGATYSVSGLEGIIIGFINGSYSIFSNYALGSSVSPSPLTKVDDTNVTLTLGGSPLTALLQATSLTLGWTGTLADGRITSATNWNTAYTNRITSLTTTGTSGAATLIANTLNIPQYTGGSGTVTSVAALTLGTTGTDLSSTVANSTTTPVITLQVPTASAFNRGVLSSTDWSTFNNKQAALTNPITGTGTTNEIAYFSGTSALSSLTTATYPTLTELSYVKGSTSAIQTQLNSLNQYDDQFAMYQDVGSAVVTGTYGIGIDRTTVVSTGALADGQIIYMLVRFRKADTILGLKWLQGTQGNYTADNYNGVFIGTLSGGTNTIQAISTNDGAIWKGAANTWQSKAFTSGYAVTANTTYVVGAVYNNSAQVTLPTIYGAASNLVSAAQTLDFTNSVKLYGSKTGVASIAVADTQAWSGLTGSNILPMFFPYK